MRALFAIVLGGGIACAALAQDDPIETRRFTADFLLRQAADVAGIPLGLAMDSIAVGGHEAAGGMLSGDDLVSILKADSAPGTWEAPGASIESDDGVVVATHRRSVLDGISAWLSRSRARDRRRIVTDAALVLVPADRWGKAPPRELASSGRVLKRARLSGEPGRQVVAQDLQQRSYVRDHDVQIATSAASLDPSVDVLNTGALIELRMLSASGGERILLDVRAELAVFEALEDKKLKLTKIEPAAPVPAAVEGGPVVPVAMVAKDWEALVQLPSTTYERIRGQVLATPGETVLAGAASRADGVLALFLTPAFAEAAADAPVPAGVQTRLYDVSALTDRVQDWIAPRVELAGPSRGGAGPLTGATFTLSEPRVGYGEETLRDELRSLVDPPGTERQNTAVEPTYGRAVRVRATHDRHAAVEAKLRELFKREVSTLRSEAVAFAFKPTARAELEARVPALRAGATRSKDEETEILFDEARKGGAVRLAAQLAISGRPNQRVHAFSGRQRAYVQDFEPQVSSFAAVFDPIIGVQISGIGLDARPGARDEDGSIRLELRAWTLGVEMDEEKQVSTGGGPVQRPRSSGFVWNADVVCVPGHWTVAALESRGEGDAAEEVLLLVRVR